VIVTPKAATQLRALEPDAVAAILDTLDHEPHPSAPTVTEIHAPGVAVRFLVARHRDGSTVLVSITAKGRNRHDRD